MTDAALASRREAVPPLAIPRDIVFGALVDWGRMPYWRWRSLFRAAVAAGHRVLWVDHFSSWGSLRRLPRDPSLLRSRLVEADHGIFHLASPLRLRDARGPFAAPAAALALRSTRDAMRRLRFESPLLWISSPSAWRLIGRLGERTVVYDCVDDLTRFGGEGRIAAEERLLISRVDLVVTCVGNVGDDKVAMGAPVTCIPNGVDAEHFRAALAPAPAVPALRSLPRPIIGYSGVLYDRVDWALVELACRAEPLWSFVFIGRVETPPPTRVAALPNLHVLGEVPFEALPAYYAGMDACWVPHKVNELTRRQSSLKTYEYLAAGLPAVSTDLPLPADVRAQVRVGRTPAEVVDALREAVAGDTEAGRQARLAVAAHNSWRARFELFSARLAEVRA